MMVLNNDTIVDGKLLVSLLSSFELQDKKVGIVSPKIYFARGFEFHKRRYSRQDLGRVIWYAGGRVDWNNVFGVNVGVDEVDNGQFDEECETDFATGCCSIFRLPL